jgi:hypothetical protein
MKTIYFGFAGYPEIKRIETVLMPRGDRQNLEVGQCLGARVVVGDFKGICSFNPESKEAFDVKAVLDYAKRCVDYQRKKQGDLRESDS